MDISLEAQKCLGCPKPQCAAHCPCGNAINEVLSLLKRGEEEAAARKLHETNPFPELTSLLCDHRRQCLGHCVKGIRGEPVHFPEVEYELSQRYPFSFQPEKRNGKRLALIGAGPASLSFAAFANQAGFAVDIYEKEETIGGAIHTGIPGFRFDKSVLNRIQSDLVAAGVTFHFCHEVSLEESKALATSYDAVIFSIGAEKENRLSIDVGPTIVSALPLLRQYNLEGDFGPLSSCKRIVVMGGGNVAMDVSRSLRREGKEVTLIYRRDEASMPAQRVEIEEAKAEGVIFMPLTNLASPELNEAGEFVGLHLVKMFLGEKDETGRPSFHTVEGSEFFLPCDAFVMAIGEKSCLSDYLPGESFGDIHVRGNIYAIGDCRYGAKNVAAAIKDGREAAKAIIEDLND